MAKIKPSLNLNGTPQSVENYSLVSAHNIAVNEEGAIIPDYGMSGTNCDYRKATINDDLGVIGVIVGINSKLYVFIKDYQGNYGIDEYDEISNQKVRLNCAWTYHGGKITGNVTINNTNEYILNICESDAIEDVPIKHINLSKCSSIDNESIYTQNPNIPITNLYLTKTYTKNIPNGVYQFFIRYRIRDEFYTGWFPCSKECFAGVSQVIRTVQGQIKYVKTNIDSAKAFIFNVEHIFNGEFTPGQPPIKPDYTKLYKDYQIGFILSTNDSMVARSWKSFNFDVTQIKFDYDEAAIEEIDIKEMLEVNYEIFNVKNIAYFRNKQYISNFKETDFNPDLENISKSIGVHLDKHEFNTEGLFIDGKKLTDEDETSGGTTYYKKWGDKNAYEIITNQNLINKNRVETTISTKDSNVSKQYGFYEYTVKCDFTVNPDLLWVCAGRNDNNISNFPFVNFGFNGSYISQKLFRIQGVSSAQISPTGQDATLIKDTQIHPWDNTFYTVRKWRYAATPNSSYTCPNTDNFVCSDKGFGGNEEQACADSASAFANYFKNDKVHFGACRVIGAYVLDGTTKYFIYGSASTIDESDADAHLNDPFDFTGYGVDDRQEANDSFIENLVKSKIIGVTEDGSFVGKFGTNEVTFDKYYIVYSEFNYYCSNPTSGSTINNVFTHDMRIDVERTNYRIEKSCAISDRYIKLNNASDEKQYNTLLPFTEYEFYVHYVKQNGIATNGYIINNGVPVIMNSYDSTNYNAVIYPIFSNINLPAGYVSCFFSIYKTGNDICKCFNHELRNDGYHYVDCLEADTLLYNIKNKVVIIDNDGVELTSSGDESQPELVQAAEAEYYSSSDFTPVEMIGNSGCIRWGRNAVTDAIDYELIEISNQFEIPMSGGYIALLCNINGTDNIIKTTIPPNTDFTPSILSDIRDSLTDQIDGLEVSHYIDDLVIKKVEGTQRTLIFKVNSKEYNHLVPGSKTDYILESKISSLGFSFAETEEEVFKQVIEHKVTAPHPIDSDELWVKINNTYSTNKDKQLIRITPYIDIIKLQRGVYPYDKQYNNYEDLNSPGYLCKVYKPNRNYSNDIFVSGTDIYNKDIASANAVKLNPYYDIINLNRSNSAYILSNFNLNYVSLNEEINPQVRIYKTSADDTIGGIQVIKALNSLTASFALQLESMYRSYLRKYYYVYDPNKLTQFANTIRSSDVNTDEVYRNIYKFYSEDYYNVPVNRGPIVNMFAVLNEIYIHCEHSLFKFNGNNTLTANEGEVNLKESNVFDTGIVEIFDSQHGYAGLSKKHHGLVTFNYYIFYDKLNKHLYAYDTQKGLVNLGESIQYIINKYSIDDVVFADDSNNNRILISFKLSSSHTNIFGFDAKDHITLSFNFKTNSFISIHDFSFRYSVSSRLYCYLIHTIGLTSLIFDAVIKIDNNIFINDDNSGSLSLFDLSVLTTKELNFSMITANNGFPSCVDIIYNADYEKIKVFNNVSWICNKNTIDVLNKYVADCKREPYPGHGFVIYSDQIYSNYITTGANGDDISNSYNLNNNNSFKLVRYNNGIFEINYFRDETIATNPDTEVPLIHGKYFVFRIYLNQYNFRLENITINCQNYEKA